MLSEASCQVIYIEIIAWLMTQANPQYGYSWTLDAHIATDPSFCLLTHSDVSKPRTCFHSHVSPSPWINILDANPNQILSAASANYSVSLMRNRTQKCEREQLYRSFTRAGQMVNTTAAGTVSLGCAGVGKRGTGEPEMKLLGSNCIHDGTETQGGFPAPPALGQHYM